MWAADPRLWQKAWQERPREGSYWKRAGGRSQGGGRLGGRRWAGVTDEKTGSGRRSALNNSEEPDLRFVPPGMGSLRLISVLNILGISFSVSSGEGHLIIPHLNINNITHCSSRT